MIRITKSLACIALSTLLPATAFADIKFTNHSSSDVTFFYKHWCSHQATGGVIAPNGGSYTLKQNIIDSNCYRECVIDVYTSSNCSGAKIATAKISGRDGGVTTISNFSSNYVVEGSGSSASIKELGLVGWFKSLLN